MAESEGALGDGERAEPERPPARAEGRGGSLLAVILIVLGCMLAPLSIVAVWSSNQISDTDHYVQNVTPLAGMASVQNAVATRVTNALVQQINVPQILTTTVGALESRGLPALVGDKLTGLAGPLVTGLTGFVYDKTLAVIRSDAFQTLWVNANRIAHEQLNAVLSGTGSRLLKVSGDTISISLGPIIAQVKQKLVESGMKIAAAIPAINPTFALFKSQDLAKAQTAYSVLNALRWILPIVSLVLLAGGVLLARARHRALAGAGIGLAVAMVVLAAGLAIGRLVYLHGVAANGLDTSAAGDIFDVLVRFLRTGLRMVLVLGLVVAAGAYLTGSAPHAVRIRTGAQRLLARARGDRGNPWVHENRTALRIGVVALAGVVFVFWDHPTGNVVLLLTVLVLVALAVVELLGRTPSPE